MRARTLAGEGEALHGLIKLAGLSEDDRRAIAGHASDLVTAIRAESKPRLMESFLEEYGLTTREGVALMCLAEALLRVPDAPTIDALIEDKRAPSDWARPLGHSTSPFAPPSALAVPACGPGRDAGGGGEELLAAGAGLAVGLPGEQRLGAAAFVVSAGERMVLAAD